MNYSSIITEFVKVRAEIYQMELNKEPIDPSTLHLVLYSDGGYRSTKDVSGWGVHGYIGTTIESRTTNGHSRQEATSLGYLDKKDVVVGKDAVPLTVLKYIDLQGGNTSTVEKRVTNNTAELDGITVALYVIAAMAPAKATVFTDSMYALRLAQDMAQKFEKANAGRDVWLNAKKEPLKNLPFIKELLKAKALVTAATVDLKLEKIKGHSGMLGNDMADYNATAAMNEWEQTGTDAVTLRVDDVKGYWNYKPEYHKFLYESWWYEQVRFNTDKAAPPIYYVGNHGESTPDLFGKPHAHASFAVVVLDKPDPVLEKIRQWLPSLKSPTGLFAVNLTEVLRPFNHRSIDVLSPLSLRYKTRAEKIISPNQVVLADSLVPIRRSNEGFSLFGMLEQTLSYVQDASLPPAFHLTDITNAIFEPGQDSKGKPKLTFKLDTDDSFNVTAVHYADKDSVDTVTLTLSLGLDLPKRNALSTLTKSKPKVEVLTHSSNGSEVTYYVVITTEDAIGLWTAAYSNVVIKKSV